MITTELKTFLRLPDNYNLQDEIDNLDLLAESGVREAFSNLPEGTESEKKRKESYLKGQISAAKKAKRSEIKRALHSLAGSI